MIDIGGYLASSAVVAAAPAARPGRPLERPPGWSPAPWPPAARCCSAATAAARPTPKRHLAAELMGRLRRSGRPTGRSPSPSTPRCRRPSATTTATPTCSPARSRGSAVRGRAGGHLDQRPLRERPAGGGQGQGQGYGCGRFLGPAAFDDVAEVALHVDGDVAGLVQQGQGHLTIGHALWVGGAAAGAGMSAAADDEARQAGRPAVFLDRDGTLVEEVAYLHDPDRVVFLPVGSGLRRRPRPATPWWW